MLPLIRRVGHYRMQCHFIAITYLFIYIYNHYIHTQVYMYIYIYKKLYINICRNVKTIVRIG